MKKITFLMCLLVGQIYSQTTNIPDTSFEDALILAGVDVTDAMGFPDGFIDNADAANVQSLIISNSNILDLTGIEAFVNLTYLDISFNGFNTNNPLTNVNLSNSSNLQTLICNNNFMIDIDISNLQNLETLNIRDNEMSDLDITASTGLKFLNIENNNLQSIDLSQHPFLQQVTLQNNQLSDLNIKNSANTILTTFNASVNLNLSCIDVDNELDAIAGNGSYANWVKDTSTSYSDNCATLSNDGFYKETSFIYPNPSHDFFQIMTKDNIQNIVIYNLNGKLVKRFNKSLARYSIKELENGLYFLKIQSTVNYITKKIVKR